MRYDVPVVFITEGEEVFDPTTGDYITTPGIRVQRWASVSDTGEERQNLLYGGIKQSALTVRLQDRPPKFDRLEIGGIPYGVTLRKNFRRETVLYVNSL